MKNDFTYCVIKYKHCKKQRDKYIIENNLPHTLNFKKEE